MFGKVMRVSDELMLTYYELLTDKDLSAVKAQHPMEAKKALAELLTARFHGEPAAKDERRFFDETFSKKELPKDIPSFSAPAGLTLSELILRCGATKSRNEARRLITQGGVKIDGKKAPADEPVREPAQFVLQVGKHQVERVELGQ